MRPVCVSHYCGIRQCTNMLPLAHQTHYERMNEHELLLHILRLDGRSALTKCQQRSALPSASPHWSKRRTKRHTKNCRQEHTSAHSDVRLCRQGSPTYANWPQCQRTQPNSTALVRSLWYPFHIVRTASQNQYSHFPQQRPSNWSRTPTTEWNGIFHDLKNRWKCEKMNGSSLGRNEKKTLDVHCVQLTCLFDGILNRTFFVAFDRTWHRFSICKWEKRRWKRVEKVLFSIKYPSKDAMVFLADVTLCTEVENRKKNRDCIHEKKKKQLQTTTMTKLQRTAVMATKKQFSIIYSEQVSTSCWMSLSSQRHLRFIKVQERPLLCSRELYGINVLPVHDPELHIFPLVFDTWNWIAQNHSPFINVQLQTMWMKFNHSWPMLTWIPRENIKLSTNYGTALMHTMIGTRFHISSIQASRHFNNKYTIHHIPLKSWIRLVCSIEIKFLI